MLELVFYHLEIMRNFASLFTNRGPGQSCRVPYWAGGLRGVRRESAPRGVCHWLPKQLREQHWFIRCAWDNQCHHLPTFEGPRQPLGCQKAVGNDPVFKTTLSRRKPNPSSLLVAPFLQLLFLSSHSHEGACSHADVWFNVGCFPSLRSLGGLCPKFNLVLAYSFQLGCINHQLKSSYSSIFEVKTNCWWICSSSTFHFTEPLGSVPMAVHKKEFIRGI